MEDNEINASDNTNDAKGSDSQARPEGIVNSNQSNPNNQTSATEQSKTNKGTKPILPVRMWQSYRTWWSDPFRPKANFAEKLTVFITIVIAGIGAMQACIYHGQLGVMGGQLEQMRQSGGQTDKLICLYQQQLAQLTKQVGDTHELAVQAKNQANATRSVANNALAQANATDKVANASRDAVQVSIDALHTAHRPWVSVVDNSVSVIQPISFDSTNGAHAKISFSLKNVGNSPALKVTMSPVIRIGTMNMLLETTAAHCGDLASMAELSKEIGSFLIPGQSNKVDIARDGTWYIPQGLPKFLIPGIKRSPTAVLLEICISYRDEFEKFHATGSYWIYESSDGKWEFMPKGTIEGHWKTFDVGSTAY